MQEALAPGTVIDGKYRVERVLGEGGMATVYEATHIHLNDRVAIKILFSHLLSTPTIVERFMREAKAAVRLKNEHVVRVIDVGTLASQQPYIVLEFLDGQDLAALLEKRGGRIPADEAVDYVMQLCEALAEAHAAGIVHRDIKPANCVLAKRNDGMPILKVLDFGIAKLTLADAGPKLTATQATMGTPAFMSPEQVRGAKDVDHRGDIWAVGITLFQLITGNVPFYGNTYAKLVMAVTRDATPAMPNVPPGLQDAVNRCLAKDRDQRFANIGELAVALAPFARERGEAQQIAQRCVGLARAQARSATPAAGVPLQQQQPKAPTQPPPNTPLPPGYQTQLSAPVLPAYQTPASNPSAPAYHTPPSNPSAPAYHTPTSNPPMGGYSTPASNPSVPAYQPPSNPAMGAYHTPTSNPSAPAYHTPTSNPPMGGYPTPTSNPNAPTFHTPASNPSVPAYQNPPSNPAMGAYHTPTSNPSAPAYHTPTSNPPMGGYHTPTSNPPMGGYHTPTSNPAAHHTPPANPAMPDGSQAFGMQPSNAAATAQPAKSRALLFIVIGVLVGAIAGAAILFGT